MLELLFFAISWFTFMMNVAGYDALLLIFLLYFHRSLPLLLPVVEDGIFNDIWSIQQSSVELLGDLLFKVCSGLITTIKSSNLI
jgi:hypothetical protein